MTRRRHVVLALAFCLLSSGAQWDLLQVFAWSRMIVNYSQTMPLSAAVKQTLGGRMCRICRMVASAERQKQTPSNRPEAKLRMLLFYEAPSPVVVEAPPFAAGCPIGMEGLAEIDSKPPVPPPRGAIV